VTDKSLDEKVLHFSGVASRLKRLDASMVLWLALIAVLAFLVLNPVLRLIISSLQETDTGRFTLANYRVAYGNWRHLQALLNSLELGIGVALLATLFGVPIAWAISRTDMPGKAFIRLMVFAAFVTPPYLGAIGWILLAGPNSGWLNKVWMALTGAEHGVFNIYSMTGLDPGRGRDLASLHVRVHQLGARLGVLGDGRRGQYPRRPHASDHAARHAAAGDPRDHRRHHHQLLGSHRAVRRAGADRPACPLQRGLDATLAVLRISGPG
jgi:hypothetical protein